MTTITRTMIVNGRTHTVAFAPGETLLDVLRDRLGLTGTKKGCNLGDCGACTVWVDDQPMNACLILAREMEGRRITTIEGLAHNGQLTAIQEAFVSEGGIQCGFCTPGMVMSASALLRRSPEPSDDEIRTALAGNLCRCTGYAGILRAVRRAAGRAAHAGENDDTPPPREPLTTVGTSPPRLDGIDKVTGRARYAADIQMTGMLWGRILGSPIAHGVIKRIDTSKAEALDGVVAVITGADVPDILYGVSPARYDEYVLAKDRVRYVGDQVAAVAAVDERIAERALELIEVEYEELPAVLDPYAALAKGAPQLHERYERNINTHISQHFGDVERGFAQSHLIREESFTGNHVHQAPLEPCAAVAHWESDGTLVLHTSTQVPHYIQYMMAHVLEIPLGKVRIMRPTVGGAFGGKAETTPLDLCSAVLAKRTGRPVKMVFSREEMFHHGRGRHKQYMNFRLGLDADGRIQAFDSEIYLDGGAYTSFGVATAYYAGSMIPTLYHIPNYRYEGYRIMTNKPACGAMRGHGVPQPRFAFECLLSMMADELGIDPIEIRRRNAMDPDTRTINDLDIGSCEFRATLDKVAEKSGWNHKYGKLPKGKGIGIGCGGFVSGAGYSIYRGSVQLSHEKGRAPFEKRSVFPHANAIVRITEDGTQAILLIGAAEIGQGSDTVLTQMCAEALGIPPGNVRIRSEDSDISGLDLGAYSSRVTLMGGHAVARAARDVVAKIRPIAAAMLNCDEKTIVARNGFLYASTDPDRKVAWAEAARRYFNDNGPLVGTGWYKPPDGLGGDYKGATVGTSPAFSFGSAVCEVDVDLETGKVAILKFTDYHDCGTAVNPRAVHGQVEGAVVMGASETVLEETRFDATGHIINPDFHSYQIMTIKDAPEIFSGLVDSYEPRGPFGAKEIGEGSTLPVLGAVAHAIANATGVWIKDLPITPEKILNALRQKKQPRQPAAV